MDAAHEFDYPQDVTVSASQGPTPSQTVGPFFHYALPYEAGPDVVGAQRPRAVTLEGRVLDGAGEPIPDALVEIWQADESGRFGTAPRLYETPSPEGFRGFGRCPTERDGSYRFRTVKPGGVPTVDGRAQAPHIALAVFARGMLRQAVTRVCFDDEPDANGTDPLLSTLEPTRRGTLLARATSGGYHFDVRVQGENETVFLDVSER